MEPETHGALIVCAAPLPGHADFYRDLLSRYTGPLIAVDGGGDVCLDALRPPEVLVGDLDSITGPAVAYARESGALMLPAPRDKDVTDLDLALAAATDLGHDRVLVTAAWSGRLDHTLSATGTVLSESGLTIDLVDPDMCGAVLDAEGRCAVRLDPPGATFTLMSVDPEAVVSCSGARYALSHARLGALSSLGLSNVVAEDGARVTADRGRILVLSHTVGMTEGAAIQDAP